MIRCKFKCTVKTQTAEGYKIEMETVTQGSKENEQFFKWTPAGRLNMGTINENAAAVFVPGKEYYIDISEAKTAD